MHAVELLKILLLCVAAACVFGIAHDQVTARISVEYFTIGHPIIVDTTSPTVLGLVWGVEATWWMGLLVGIPVTIAARAGRRPKLRARQLVRPIAVLLLAMAVAALLAGLVGHLLASRGDVVLYGFLAERVPVDRHPAFLTALWAHSASYVAGVIGGVVLIIVLRRTRGRCSAEAQAPVPPSSS
jgi:hypothetical protein